MNTHTSHDDWARQRLRCLVERLLRLIERGVQL